ncbi:MAG: transpeptidase family protein [Flavobacteriaceae bacterium]|nr:transpeptidase family protein [Flavobacteriaceae bacterium]MCI5088567.1 transpeptidase family protein [Flavobacteriaceae bacterium]
MSKEKNILIRLYLVVGALAVFAVALGASLLNIQLKQGAKYKKLAAERTEKVVTIEPSRGSLISDDGSLLATSVSRYEIRYDALTVKKEDFEAHIGALSDSLSVLLKRPAAEFEQKLRKATARKNRYALVASNLSFDQYRRLKEFPLFSKGPYRGGIVVTQKTVREHPLGEMAARSVGFVSTDASGHITRVGLEGAFDNYLKGEAGKRLKQKIAKGQWKPLGTGNIKEPKEGSDVVTTININIQDIAHHALLGQLEKYKADHGTVVVMETKTGEIKALSNLGRNAEGFYSERLNYAIGESHEPGSTFKLMSMAVALEDKVIDTATVIDTENGRYRVYDRTVRDSKAGGYGEISAAKALKVSSNTAFAKMIHENYKDNPRAYVDRLRNMNLHEPLGLPVLGEGLPVIRYPGDRGWSGVSLAWMSHGYEVSLTPLQTLSFYNAIANGGEMVRPRLIKEIRRGGETIQKFHKTVINPSICSKETVNQLQQILKEIVQEKGGTGHGLYDPNFSMAGKTGTCQKDYGSGDPDKLKYISTFAGYFPAEQPEYSCIVVIHEPDKHVGYYGADVSGPVFKAIAQKMYTSKHLQDEVSPRWMASVDLDNTYHAYESALELNPKSIPNLKGMAGMDAVALMENLGYEVLVNGNGKVVKQSISSGAAIKKGGQIELTLSRS